MSVTTTEPTTQTGAEPGTNNGGAQGGAPVAQPQTGNDDKTFTQHQVSAIVGARLKEAQAKWEKDQKDAADTAEAEKRGEYETVIAKERDRATKAEADLEAEREARRRDRVESAIQIAAQGLGFHDAEDAISRIELSQVTFGDDGKPKNVLALVTKLAEDKPYLIATGQQGSEHIPRTPNGSTMTQEEFRAQEKDRALRSGKYSSL